MENETKNIKPKFNRKYLAGSKSTQYLLTLSQQGVLTYLIDVQDFFKTETFFISFQQISHHLGISKTSAEKFVNELIEYEFITLEESRQAQRKPNIYSINNEEINKYDKYTVEQIIEIRESNKKTRK